MDRFIKKFDIFGSSFSPTVSYNVKSASLFGGFFGLCYIAFSVILFITFGKSLFYKDEPNVIEQHDINPATTIRYNIPITHNITYELKSDISEYQETLDRDLFINGLDRVIEYIPTYTEKNITRIVKQNNCRIRDFTNVSHISQSDENLFTELKCFNLTRDNLTLYQKFGDSDVKSIEMSFYICKNSTSKNNCISEEESKRIFSIWDFRLYFYYAGYDYDSRNAISPFTSFLEFFYTKFIVHPQVIPVTHYLEVQKVSVDTDFGFLFPVIYKDSSQRFSKFDYLVGGPKEEKNRGDNVPRPKLNEIVIYVSKDSAYISRTYQKVQDVISNVLAVILVTGFLLQQIIQRVYDSKTQELIIHQLFNISEEMIAESIDEKENMDDFELNLVADNLPKEEVLSINRAVVDFASKSVKHKGTGEMSELELIEHENQSRRKGIRIQRHTSVLKQIEELNKDREKEKEENCKDLTSKHLCYRKKTKSYANHFELLNKFRNKFPTSVLQVIDSKSPENISKIKNYNYSITEKGLLTLVEHFLITYLICCVCGRIKRIHDYYNKVRRLSSQYTDILNMTYSMFEFEKLKFTLMDEDQIAVFNHRSKIEVDKNLQNLAKFNYYYYFTKDLNDSVDVREIKRDLVKREQQKLFNQKLSELYI